MSPVEILSWRLTPATVSLAVAALLVQTLLWLVRPSSPQARRIVWACVLFSGTVVLRIPINIPHHRPDATAAEEAAAMVQTRSDAPPETDTPPALAPRVDTPLPGSTRPFPADDARVSVAGAAVRGESQVPPLAAPGLSSALWRPTWWQAAFAAWALGGLFLLGLDALCYLRFARSARRFEPAIGEWEREWRGLLTERKIHRQIPMVVSRSFGPALCLVPAGYRLVVPRSLWTSLSEAERLAILRHELAHYERSDLLKSLLARLIVALHWFNPAAWWAQREFEAAGEWACDDRAASECGEIAFARTLMQLASMRFPAVPLTDAAGGGAVYARIRRLLTVSSGTETRWKTNVTALMSLAVIALASIRVVRVAEATPPRTFRVLASNAAESPPATKPDVPSSSIGAPGSDARLDQFGDPLPKGVVLRLGTLRLRHSGVERTAFSSDGRIIASMAWTGTFGLWERKTGRLIRMLQDSVGNYTLGRNFALSPEGGKLLSVGRFFEKKVEKGYVCLWETRTGKKLWSATTSGRDAFASVAFSPDGTLVAAGPRPFTLFDVASGKELRRCGEPPLQSGSPRWMRLPADGPMVFSPDGRTLITFQGRHEWRQDLMDRRRPPKAVTSEPAIEFWEVQTGKRTESIPVSHDLEIVTLCISADSKQLIAGGCRNVPASQFPRPIRTLNALVPEIAYWDLSTHTLRRNFRFDQSACGVGAISVSKDQATIAWNVGNAVLIWDPVAGKPLRQFPGRFGPSSLSLSPDGTAFAAACGNVIEIWETGTGRRLPADLGDFITSINAVRFSRDGRTIYTGSGDHGHLTAWDATTGAIRFRKAHGALPSISCLDASDDGRWIATCGMKEGRADGQYVYAATLWDARTGEPVRDYYDHERPLSFIQGVAIAPDARLLAFAGKRRGNEVVTQIWDVKTGVKVAEISPEEWEMQSLCMRFSPDSRSLITFNATSYLRRWNAMTGALEREFFAAKTPADPQRTHWINGAAIAPDFQTAVSSERQSLDTWNTRSGELASVIQLAPTSPPQRLFKDLAISGDGRLLAAVETVSLPDRDTNSVICIYDRASGRELQKIDAGTLFGGLDFSPDGSRLAGVMRDGTALIWDLSPAQRLPHK